MALLRSKCKGNLAGRDAASRQIPEEVGQGAEKAGKTGAGKRLESGLLFCLAKHIAAAAPYRREDGAGGSWVLAPTYSRTARSIASQIRRW